MISSCYLHYNVTKCRCDAIAGRIYNTFTIYPTCQFILIINNIQIDNCGAPFLRLAKSICQRKITLSIHDNEYYQLQHKTKQTPWTKANFLRQKLTSLAGSLWLVSLTLKSTEAKGTFLRRSLYTSRSRLWALKPAKFARHFEG